jgi:hypothetical protein
MKSHSGGFGTLGKVAFYATSTTQKLNKTSPTESEIMAAAEVLPQVLWTTSFLRHQGYAVKNAVLNQDKYVFMTQYPHFHSIISLTTIRVSILILFYFISIWLETTFHCLCGDWIEKFFLRFLMHMTFT